LDWLDSRHTFSFDQYFDPHHMGFGPLRVINEDIIAGGGGFGRHPHRDMEIITYVIEGQLRHQDSLGNGSFISPGEIQKMSAGSGIQHSEYNASKDDPVHLLQIWIQPDKRGIQPAYEQEKFELKPGEWKLLASQNGDGLISIEQRVKLYALSLEAGTPAVFAAEPASRIWVQLVKGACSVGGNTLSQGDGLAIENLAKIEIHAQGAAELLLFEMVV
jgi:redox-sensitive bicupin YhaK (pirin superfamily)